MKRYKGNAPTDAERIARFERPCALCGEREVWTLWRRPDARGWVNLKLTAGSPACNKGNYWLGYSLRCRRFNGLPDQFRLQEHRPQLFNATADFVTAYFSGGQR